MRWAFFVNGRAFNILLKAQFSRHLEIRTRGYDARVPNTAWFVIFLDYDNIVGKFSENPERRLKEELRFLQEESQLGNFHVFGTSKSGRHAVCIDCLPFRYVYDVIWQSTCDPLYKRAPSISEYRSWVLRTYKKGDREAPKYLYTVESPFEGVNPQSLPHANYLHEKFGLSLALKNPFTLTGQNGTAIEQEYNTSEKKT